MGQGMSIKRRSVLTMSAAWLCHEMVSRAVPTSHGPTSHGIDRPNIIFLLADDLGWSDTSVYGADLADTPNLARLAKSGVRFTNAYSAAPVCSPTRASLLTGKYPARLHMTTWYEASQVPPMNKKLIPPVSVADLPLSETTIAEVLHQKGYLTAHIGKWHLGSAGYYPENQGFDINIGGTFWAPLRRTSIRTKGPNTLTGKLAIFHIWSGESPESILQTVLRRKR